VTLACTTLPVSGMVDRERGSRSPEVPALDLPAPGSRGLAARGALPAPAAGFPGARGRTEAVSVARPGSEFTRDFECLVAWLATRTDKSTINRMLCSVSRPAT